MSFVARSISYFRAREVLTAAVFIAALGLIVYANSLEGEFLWDDEYLVENNLYIRDFSNLSRIFTEDLGDGAHNKYGYYRPLQILSYTVDHSLWGLNAGSYHLTNIVLHILAALALYWFITILFGDRLLSLLTACLFVVHPVHIEAVTYISGRADPLAAIFMLLCFIFYIRCLKAGNLSDYILIWICYTCALLSKETALIVPLLILVYHYAFKRVMRIKSFVPFLILPAVYIVARFIFLTAAGIPGSKIEGAFLRLPGFFFAIINYLRLLIVPFDLHMDYGKRLFALIHPGVITGIILTLAVLVYSFKKKKSRPLFLFAALWFFITLLPSSNIYSLAFYMAEHYLYLPSMGVFLIAANLLTRFYRNERFKKINLSLICALLIFYSGVTIYHNRFWSDPETFYLRIIKYNPKSASAYSNLGVVYDRGGHKDKAAAMFNQALKVDPDHPQANLNMGNIFYIDGEFDKAIYLYKKAIKAKPSYPGAYYNLACVYNDQGKKKEALYSLNKAIALSPGYIAAYNLLGVIAKDMKDYKAAAVYFLKALEIYPDYAQAHNNLAVLSFRIGQYRLAIKHADRALELGGKVSPDFLKLLKPHRL